MPIDSKHPSCSDHINQWQRCRDVYLGDDSVKARGQAYLPKIDANQSDQEYRSYASRATLFEALGKTLDSFIGAISRRPHKFDLPARMQSMIDDATLSGISLSELVKRLCKENLLTGRGGIVADYDATARRSYLSFYHAEFIINWSASRIVLAETVFEEDPADPYKLVAIDQFRELALVDGVYTVTLWRKPKADTFVTEWQVYGDAIQPTRRGKTFDRIPFF